MAAHSFMSALLPTHWTNNGLKKWLGWNVGDLREDSFSESQTT